MSKKILVKFFLVIAVLIVGILWLLSIVDPDLFGKFKFSYAIAIICGIWGLTFLAFGLLSKSNVLTKKMYFVLATGLLVGACFAIFASFGLEDKYVGVVVFIIVIAVLLFNILGSGGKSWDEGDNQKVGYKNYYQRKAEEEKAKEKAEKEE